MYLTLRCLLVTFISVSVTYAAFIHPRPWEKYIEEIMKEDRELNKWFSSKNATVGK